MEESNNKKGTWYNNNNNTTYNNIIYNIMKILSSKKYEGVLYILLNRGYVIFNDLKKLYCYTANYHLPNLEKYGMVEKFESEELTSYHQGKSPSLGKSTRLEFYRLTDFTKDFLIQTYIKQMIESNTEDFIKEFVEEEKKSYTKILEEKKELEKKEEKRRAIIKNARQSQDP